MVDQKTGFGGRIIPALRYRDGSAAIDWLCTVFGFARKMVVPGEGGKIAHAELTLDNGMIMLGDVETEYGRLVAAPASTWWSMTSMRITPGRKRPAPRS